MRNAALVVPFLLLAGCADASEVADPPMDLGSLSGTDAEEPPSAPIVETLPFSFDGDLGTFVRGCVLPAGTCHGAFAVEDLTDLFIERPGANLTSLSFEMTWQAQSPATQDLWVGAMVMTSCEGCNDTSFQDAHGTSPVRVDIHELSVPLSVDASVHIYVYNPDSFIYDPAVPAYAQVSVEQPFHIEGTATVLVPPA